MTPLALQFAVGVLLFLVVVPVILRALAVLGIRFGARGFLSAIGRKALERVPEELGLRPEPGAIFADPAAMDAIVRPLTEIGFADLGIFTTPKMAGMKMQVLWKESDALGAFAYEHARSGRWLEMSTRYEDGTTTAISNMPPTGISHRPPFFRRIEVPPGTPGNEMYARLMAERSQYGVKPITAESVIEEYELAYAQIVAWQKNRGLSPEEVAAIGKRWIERRRAGKDA